MERIAIEKLIKWNDSKRRKPLIVRGARQVGKTYLIKDIFAKRFYENNYIYIDFKIEDEINEFCSKTANAEKFKRRLKKTIKLGCRYGGTLLFI